MRSTCFRRRSGIWLLVVAYLVAMGCAPSARSTASSAGQGPQETSAPSGEQTLRRLNALARAEPWSARPMSSAKAQKLVSQSQAAQTAKPASRVHLALLRSILDMRSTREPGFRSRTVEALWNAHPELRALYDLAKADADFLSAVALWRYILITTGDAAYGRMADDLLPLLNQTETLEGYSRHFHALALIREGRFPQLCRLLEDAAPAPALLGSSAFVLNQLPDVNAAGVEAVDTLVLRMVRAGKGSQLDLEPYRDLLVRSGPAQYAASPHPDFCALRRKPWFPDLALHQPVLLAPLAGCKDLTPKEAGAVAAQWLQLTYGSGARLRCRQVNLEGPSGQAMALAQGLCQARGPRLLAEGTAGGPMVVAHREVLADTEHLVVKGSGGLRLRLDMKAAVTRTAKAEGSAAKAAKPVGAAPATPRVVWRHLGLGENGYGFDWQDVQALCAATGWRLPTMKELKQAPGFGSKRRILSNVPYWSADASLAGRNFGHCFGGRGRCAGVRPESPRSYSHKDTLAVLLVSKPQESGSKTRVSYWKRPAAPHLQPE